MNACANARIVGDHKRNAIIRAHHCLLGAFHNANQLTLCAVTALCPARESHHSAVAVSRTPHVSRTNENICAAIVGREQAISTGLDTDATNDEIVFRRNPVTATAQLDEIPIAHHAANQAAKI